jgi:1-acylglycerone phosphate reductase
MKYALITGCSNGSIGSALAKAFTKHPSIHIFATSRSFTSMTDLSSYPNIILLELDVTSPMSISAALTEIKKTTSTIHFLVNYAGLGYTMPFLDCPIEDCQKIFDINVWGAMRIVQAFAPLIIAGKGTIVIAGTTVEIMGMPFQAAYCGSKAALLVMGDTLRREMKPLGVRVLHITTGLVQSNW